MVISDNVGLKFGVHAQFTTIEDLSISRSYHISYISIFSILYMNIVLGSFKLKLY